MSTQRVSHRCAVDAEGGKGIQDVSEKPVKQTPDLFDGRAARAVAGGRLALPAPPRLWRVDRQPSTSFSAFTVRQSTSFPPGIDVDVASALAVVVLLGGNHSAFVIEQPLHDLFEHAADDQDVAPVLAKAILDR